MKKRNIWLENAVDEDSNYILKFIDIAKELNIAIVITYLSKVNKSPQNTALVIDKNGNISMKNSKVHTCDFSLESLLESGEEFKVYEVD